MPNWCYNQIEIRGNKDDLIELAKSIKSDKSDFDFNNVIPYPKEYADLDTENNGKGYNSGGYEWCIDTWGTKWNACDVIVSKNGNLLNIDFETAWSPSIPITQRLSSVFPDLKFKHSYEEGGCDFSGFVVFENGESVEEQDGYYDDYPITEHESYDEDGEGEQDE